MIRQKRSDTLVGTIEEAYGLNLNARRDMKLGNLLRKRRFDSLSQLIKAARGQLNYHPAPRKVFLSFHREDLRQVTGFRLMMANERLDLAISDEPNRYPVGSERSSYIKQVLRERISRVDVLICLIGNGTAWRDWVEWEIFTASQCGCGICGIRLKGSNGRAPTILGALGAPVSQWNVPQMTSVIEQAAAVRS